MCGKRNPINGSLTSELGETEAPPSQAELQQGEPQNLRREINSLRSALEHHLWQKELTSHRAQRLREWALQMTRETQQERRRLSETVHDDLQQHLVAARMKLSTLRNRLLHDAAGRAVLGDLERLLRDAIIASRSLVVELSPPVLHEAGLGPALEWLRPRVREEHGLDVTLRVEGTVALDEQTNVTLFQVICELLDNVARHAGTRQAWVRIRPSEGRLSIEVEDRGAGFTPDDSDTTHPSGAGLGLFGIRERIEAIGGTMTIDTAPGEGTRVTLLVPCPTSAADSPAPRWETPAAQAAPSRSSPIASASKRIRLLLVDDHEVVRQGLATLLADEPDMDVIGQASNGRIGVEMALTLRPDLIVMDVTMPIMNGIDATRRITAALPGLPIVGLSAHDSEHMAREMLSAGGIAYLSKGGPSEDLVAIIRASMAKARAQNAPPSPAPS